jgi:hypothetical protein
MASSPAWILAHDWLSHLDVWLEPRVSHQSHQGDEDAQSQHCMWNPHSGGRDDWEGRNLSLKGPEPTAFRSNVRDMHFPMCFRVPRNIIKYDDKTNPSIWLEDYRLAY